MVEKVIFYKTRINRLFYIRDCFSLHKINLLEVKLWDIFKTKLCSSHVMLQKLNLFEVKSGMRYDEGEFRFDKVNWPTSYMGATSICIMDPTDNVTCLRRRHAE